jgi:hemolysin activation/secretion protein
MNASAQLADSDTAQTRGNFVKFNAWANHLQALTNKDTLYLALSGQAANTNLDQSQKMTVGGPNAVRAYDTAAVSGDNGTLVTVELRHSLDGPALGADGRWQVMAFFDSARLTINKSPWASGINQARLSGGGIGLVWVGTKQYTAQFTLAQRTGTVPALITNSSKVRAWALLADDNYLER